MCVSCISNLEALTLSSIAAATSVTTGWGHIRARLQGRLPERRRLAYERTAAYLASMGLDAHDVLGDPPGRRPPQPPTHGSDGAPSPPAATPVAATANED